MKDRALEIVALSALAIAFVLAFVVLQDGGPAPEPLLEGAGPAAEPLPAANAAASEPGDQVGGVTAVAPTSASNSGSATEPDSDASSLARTGIHAQLLGMSESGRRALLRLAVSDARFPCEAVNSASTVSDLPLWRVSCTGANFYMVTIGELQDFHVEPVQWDAPTPQPSQPLQPGFIERRTLELVPAPEPER